MNRFKVLILTGCIALNGCATKDYLATTTPGATGPSGATGVTGATGTAGATGANGSNCTATVVTGGANITCGSNAPVFLSNGGQGVQGVPGLNGTSCAATATTGGVNVTCGSNAPVFLASGTTGATGAAGNGFSSGLLCNAYTVLAADDGSNVNWFKMFSDGTEKFSTVLANFAVANESDTVLFQGFTQAEQNLVGTTNFALDCSGYLNVPEDGLYNFALTSDDGSEFVIDNTSLIDMPNTQAATSGSATNVSLYSGRHSVNMLYYQSLATNVALTLQWSGPSNAGLGTMATVAPTYFSH